jgi:hypothetical protein
MGNNGIAYMGWDLDGVQPSMAPITPAADGSWSASGLVAGGTYSLQSSTSGVDLGFEEGCFEVDREGKATDVGVMIVP